MKRPRLFGVYVDGELQVAYPDVEGAADEAHEYRVGICEERKIEEYDDAPVEVREL